MLVLFVGAAFADSSATLSAKHAKALHRLLAKKPDAQRLLVPKTCRFDKEADGVTVYQCKNKGCGHCSNIDASCEVRVDKTGVLSIQNVFVKSRPSDGSCGDCM